MKKYIIFIIIAVFLLGAFLVYSTLQIQQNNSKIFQESGYILQSLSNNDKTQNIERFYFNANEKYTNKYNEKIIFNDTNGEKVIASNENFLHYSNGSISALKKGVIMNLEEIDADPICYYSMPAGKRLKKSGNKYVTSNLDKELQFSSLIFKISDTKYLMAGNQIKVVFNDGTEKTIDGFIEIEYVDNQVIKLYNQEVTHQTVSSDVYIEMPNNIRINLANKIVSKDGENKMSFSNMVIDSDDNIEIVDLDEYNKKDEKTEEQEKKQNEQEEGKQQENNNIKEENGSKNEQSQSQSDTTTNNMECSNSGSVGSITSSDDFSNETIVEDTPTINTPVFKIKNFEVDSISMKAQIAIEDEDATLISDHTISIIKNSTGKVIYQKDESLGAFTIDLEVATLSPDTEYTLVLKSKYKVEDMEYSKNFIYKIFRTEATGISFEKDCFTNTSLKFKVYIEKDSKVKTADMVLVDENGEVIQTYSIDNMAGLEEGREIEFLGLEPDKTYTAKVINVFYDGQIIADGFEMSNQYKTLKNKPEISGTMFEIDKRNGIFNLKLENIQDENNGIEKLKYEIYDIRLEQEDAEPSLVIEASKNQQINVPVDEVKILRGVPYTFKVIAEFNDNEKIVEYESEYSDVLMMDGVEFPTVRFEEDIITFERIEGKLIIEDNSNTISLNNENKFTITYTDSVGVTNTFTSQGSLTIPVSINNLRANETYKFSIYTKVDLQDNNEPIDKCYIGGAVVKTKIPENLVAKFLDCSDGDVKNTFKVNFKLRNTEGVESTLEAQTLSAMVFSIYSGQTATGTPIRTLKVVDSNLNPYESNLKTDYYDNEATITPTFFGAQNKDFKDRYYTITVSQANDYTKYPNALPIVNNSITVEANGYMPDLPVNPNNAIDVSIIRNRDADQREDLDASTVVGYNIKAGYDNSQKYARKIKYNVYDSITNSLISSQEKEIGEDGIVPNAIFDLQDGTSFGVSDTDSIRRGNSYYFTYEVDLDLNGDGVAETKYPYQEEGQDPIVLRSQSVIPKKQEPRIIMYPSKSTNNTMTFKYKCSDVDNALESNNMTATIGNSIRDTEEIIIGGENEFKEVTFKNLTEGNLSIKISQILLKSEYAAKKELVSQYFEGFVNLNDIQYNVSLEENKVIITLLNAESKINRISTLTVEFESGETIVRKEFLKPVNNMVTINLNELGKLLNKQVTVKVYAYYDNGITGFDVDSQYKLYQKAYKYGEDIYYYYLNNERNLVETPTALENMYIGNRDSNQLNITNAINEKMSGNISLQYTEKGFTYEYDVILQKQVSKIALVSDGTDVIQFDLIIPGISLKNSSGGLNITAELDRVQFKADLILTDLVAIKNNTIYIEVYETDENGKNEKFVKTIEKKVSDFSSTIEIEDLAPKTYYYMKLKANIVKATGTSEEKYLYDVDYQTVGKQYYFSTLANVGISNIEVKYNPTNYNEKTLDISYNLERILGYNRIEYTLYKYDANTQTYEILMDNMRDTLFKKEMIKQIKCNPGSEIEFGAKYKIQIKPIAKFTTIEGYEKEIEIGTTEYEFSLAELKEPLIGINGIRVNNSTIKFKITIYDEDRIIENDKYTISIFDNKQVDITPEEYRGEYSTDILNNTITINNIEPGKRYSIAVNLKLDYDNDKTDLANYQKRYQVSPINESGISLGNISSNSNAVQRNKIDLIFYNSYKLLEIDKIRYSIYNTNGYAENDTVDFVPTQIQNEDESYYMFTLKNNLTTVGQYYIELQFLKDNEIIETYTLEHVYLEE